MMRNKIYIALACFASALSCTQFKENAPEGEVVEKVQMTFSAIIDDNAPSTRTVLDGYLGDDLRKVLWSPEDEIGITPKGTNTYQMSKFVNIEPTNSEMATFEGGIEIAEEYYAIYPYEGSGVVWYYQTEATGYHYSIIFDIPHEQKYVEGSFAQNTSPMVAKGSYGESLKFQNLCGLLALNLKGNENVRSITFVGNDSTGNPMYVSGNFHVNMDYTDTPSITPGPDGPTGEAFLNTTYKYVTVKCEEPVQLSETEATTFYFVLPPATYETFYILITTEDGRVMMREGTKPLTIKRSDVQPTASLQYVETSIDDLSLYGTANCYIVSEPGVYSIDANVMGNGDFGIIQGAGFHTKDSRISPTEVELLWEDNQGIVTKPELRDNQIIFFATGAEGNAVIAAKDSDGNILWSWHIWSTDKPEEQIYKNSYSSETYTVLDRNLGAIRADRGSDDEWEEAQGLAYQWGRKDPFTQYRMGYNAHVGYMDYCAWDVSEDAVSIETSIQNPRIFYGKGDSKWTDASMISKLWTPEQKTIYDPCPPGYMVAYDDVWRGFIKNWSTSASNTDDYNVSGKFNNGWDFIYDGTNTTYYPWSWYINIDGSVYSSDNHYCYIWSSENYNSNSSNKFQFYYYNGNSHHINIQSTTSITEGNHVRCVKDNAIKSVVTTIKPIDRTTVTSTSAPVEARVATYSKSVTISERGFVYGMSSNVSLENGTAIPCGNGVGDFNAEITGLDPQTKYYVKAYAKASDRIDPYYSSAVSFITPGDGGIVNLSTDGTANCYMVYPVEGTYTFDLVKGNSNTSVGTVRSVAVLWETLNTTDAVTAGSVINSVSFEGNQVKFSVPENNVPGNAVIVAKSAAEKVLWSWHIWVVDMDPTESAHIYPSGTMMMDRNLGALTSEMYDVRSYGLLYQWGRKDPFVGSGNGSSTLAATTAEKMFIASGSDTNTSAYAILHPETVITNSNWNRQSDYWGIYKTIYDPCPSGWRVAEADVWHNFNNFISYPYAGYGDSNGRLEEVGSYNYLWTSTRDGEGYIRYFNNSYYDNKIQSTSAGYREQSVRCMKDATYTVETVSASGISHNSATVSGNVNNPDSSEIDVVGFVYGTSSNPKLTDEEPQFSEKDGTSGSYTIKLTGLKPNTVYYVRAYAKGDYNTRYGEAISFRTASSGNGEGFFDGGDYDWE